MGWFSRRREKKLKKKLKEEFIDEIKKYVDEISATAGADRELAMNHIESLSKMAQSLGIDPSEAFTGLRLDEPGHRPAFDCPTLVERPKEVDKDS